MFPFSKSSSTERKTVLGEFQRRAGIKFRDVSLLDLAFHHRSFSNENQEIRTNNERLEFLGDAVLGMVVASHLYASMSDRPEGDLARIKSVVVSEMTLSGIADELGVDKYLVLGRGEELSGGRKKKAILADAMEAIIGAYYLDSGYRPAEKFVLTFMIPEITKVLENRHHKDYKTLLQEFYQKKYKACPKYELVRKTGPDHNRTFWVEVELNGTRYGPSKGKNKKEAEQEAARIAWEAVGEK